jgi:outer membrane protein OmpA-like peptidoglycan-associated protein
MHVTARLGFPMAIAAAFASILVSAGAARAQDAVSLQVVRNGQIGTAAPGLTVVVNQAAERLDVKVSCGGKTQTFGGSASTGQKVELRLDVPVGKHRCSGSLAGTFADGTSGEMPLSFDVVMHPKLGIQLAPGTLDTKGRTMSVVLDRPASRVEITALGLKGAEVGGGLHVPNDGRAPAPAGQPVGLFWSDNGGEVLKLRVRGFDADGFWSELELVPWSYTIPHEDVVFASDAADIAAAEEPKLASALTDARGVIDKYGADVVIKLYVGGHTDTVGDAGHNAELSLRRARAIAAWFKGRGFPGDIYYQGYGESGLAVPTPDQTDEPRNRRATYTLAARPPEASGGGDRGWKKLD